MGVFTAPFYSHSYYISIRNNQNLVMKQKENMPDDTSPEVHAAQPIKENKIQRSIFRFVRLILKSVIVYAFGILFMVFGTTIVQDLFVTKRTETNSMTYYGFAVFAALANVIFSYARTFNADNQSEISYLRGLGMRFLYSATGFLIGSVINYVIINIGKFYPSYHGTGFIFIMVNIAEGVSSALIVTAFAYAAYATYELMDHLFEKLHLNKNSYLAKKGA